MVGDPKTLQELRKIDADLKVTCRTCGHERTFDREYLITELLKRGKSTDWEAIPHQLQCRANGCRSRDVALLILPFAERKLPEPLKEFLDATDKYISACAAMRGELVETLQNVSAARARMEIAKRVLIMWAKYGVKPPR